MPLGHRAIGQGPIGAVLPIRPSPIPGKLRAQYWQALAELPRAASISGWLSHWALVLNAVGEGLPGRQRKVDPGLEYLAEVVVPSARPTKEQYKEAHRRAQDQLEPGATVTIGAVRAAWNKMRK
jgi:hypothetical protein